MLWGFLATTEPADYDSAGWRELLRSGGTEAEERVGFTVEEQDLSLDVLPSGT